MGQYRLLIVEKIMFVLYRSFSWLFLCCLLQYSLVFSSNRYFFTQLTNHTSYSFNSIISNEVIKKPLKYISELMSSFKSTLHWYNVLIFHYHYKPEISKVEFNFPNFSPVDFQGLIQLPRHKHLVPLQIPQSL